VRSQTLNNGRIPQWKHEGNILGMGAAAYFPPPRRRGAETTWRRGGTALRGGGVIFNQVATLLKI
jgi:hypothetical protein